MPLLWEIGARKGKMKIHKKTKIEYEIMREISKAIRILGGKSDILGTIGSYGDTLSDKDVLLCLKQWNEANERNDRL